MKVDYHIHLEEGPYTPSFVKRSLDAMDHFKAMHEQCHSYEWLKKLMGMMDKRISEGDYSKWWLDFYLQEALDKGIKEVGVVDHLYRFKDTRDYFTKNIDITSDEVGKMQLQWLNNVMTKNLNDFVSFIKDQQELWARKGVELRLGIEADYFEGSEKELVSLLNGYDFDFVIGSVHFYNGWGFDNPKLQHKFKEYDLHHLYRTHFETVKKAAKSKIFDFIAHLDNIKAFNYRPDETELIDVYRSVAKTFAKNDVVTEINSGLYYRYPVKEVCPSETFLDVLIEEGVQLTISSDAHFPNDLGTYSDNIIKMLLERDVREIVTFHKRKKIMKTLGL